MGPRGAGRRLNDQERMEILDILARETKVKNVDLAKRYGVSEGAIRKLKQMKDRVRARYLLGNEHNRDKRKRGGFARNAPFEQELYAWICRMREAQAYQLAPLTQTQVRQQAMLLAQKYDKMAGTFKASPGWFARFCSRHRLDPPVSSSSSAGVAGEDGAMFHLPDGAVDAAAALLPATAVSADGLMLEPKADATTELKGVETIDEQTQLAARQHNAAALGDPVEVVVDAVQAVPKADVVAAIDAEEKAVAPGGDGGGDKAAVAAVAELAVPAAVGEGEGEDEIFGLGL